jgi:hypothetical protein
MERKIKLTQHLLGMTPFVLIQWELDELNEPVMKFTADAFGSKKEIVETLAYALTSVIPQLEGEELSRWIDVKDTLDALIEASGDTTTVTVTTKEVAQESDRP